MAVKIHPTAIVDSRAQIGVDVEIGPFCVVGANVQIGDRTRLYQQVTVDGFTQLGSDNIVHPHAVLGGPPQDKKYANEPTELRIGDRNTIRESVTMNCGTVQDAGVTRVGHDNWVMAYVHVAHDCQIGDRTILANCVQLAGHVHLGNWVILGGFTGVHQFCKIGAHAMAGVGSVVLQDIPPFVMVSGNSAQAHGLNAEGLKRRGFTASQLSVLRSAYKTLYKNGLTFEEAKTQLNAKVSELASADPASADSLKLLTDFLAGVTRGIVR